jgi:hypothetical protein
MKAPLLVAIIAFAILAEAARATAPPKGGYVPDAQTAIKIAVAVWSRIYGEAEIADQKPYHATLKDGVWAVRGTFQEPKDGPEAVGGVAYAYIAQKDGCILEVGHGE